MTCVCNHDGKNKSFTSKESIFMLKFGIDFVALPRRYWNCFGKMKRCKTH